MDGSALVMSAVLSVYPVVGTILEGRKLVREFGEGYRACQREVSMLFLIPMAAEALTAYYFVGVTPGTSARPSF
jgi:hypothetical protein